MAAVDCSVKIQRELSEWKEEMPVDRRMEFGIGISLGDVVAKGEYIYGDGLNIDRGLVLRVRRKKESGGP